MKSNDFFKRLPHELCLKVVDDLDLEDMLRLRVVCQSWYAVFCDNHICAHAIKKYFPLPLEHYYKISGFNGNEQGDDKKKKDWIRNFMINRIDREHGIASRRLELHYGMDLESVSLSYCYGRLAAKEENKILVENLKTKRKIIFTTPTPNFSNSRISEKWLLSEQYLIFSHERNSSGREIMAWDLSSKCMYKTQLPKTIVRLSAYYNKVGIVTLSTHEEIRTHKSLIWDIGGGITTLREINIALNSTEEPIVSTNIFFHNVEKDVVFLVYLSQIVTSLGTTKIGTKITIHCFKAGEIIQTQHEILYTSSKPFIYRSFMTTNDNIFGIELTENPKECLQKNIYKYVTYDMNKKAFDYHEVRLHSTPWRCLFGYNNLIWRDQIYIPVPYMGIRKLQVVTISKSLSDIWDGPWRNAYSLALSSLPCSISRGESRSNSSTDGIDIPNQNLFINRDLKIWGDDSYIVLKHDTGLQVWAFDDLGLTPSHT